MTTAPKPGQRGRPAFFIHVMKTGGTTLFRHLEENFALDELYPDRELDIRYDGSKAVVFRQFTISYLRQLPEERRRRIRVYTGHFPYVAAQILGGDPMTLTILREPVERTISLLHQFRRNAPWMDPNRRPPSASRRLEEVYEDPRVYGPLVHDHQTKIFSMTIADDPTGYMQVIDVDDARLALAKENLARVDVVGLTERYGDFLDALHARFSWRVEHGERVNATPSESAQPVSESFRRRIARDNAIDIELYEHAKGLLDRRGTTR